MPYYSYNDNNSGSFLGWIPPVTRNILLVNIVMFIATLINQEFMIRTFAMFNPESPFFRIWQPVTYMFMHGSFWHLFFNMFCLVMFGSALERVIGSNKFLIFYFVAGLGAILLHTAVGYIQLANLASSSPGILTQGQIDLLRTPTLGASGSIYGIQIGYAMLYPNAVWTLLFPPISLKAKWFVLIFVAVELITGVTGTTDGVAHFAHLGGMLFGFLLLLYWIKKNKIWRP